MQLGNTRIALNAHAKINWALDITGVRANGYHDVDMIMQSITLSDQVILTHEKGLTLDAPQAPCGEENIAWRAAQLLAQHADIPCDAHIQLEKHIPSQAGLGGGSADAAAVLIGLNQLWQLHWPLERLMPLALQLGADVPFQLQGGHCRAQGIGEQLTPLPVPDRWLVLAQPAQGASTPEIYRTFDQIGTTRRPNMEALLSAIQIKQDFFGMLANALEDAAIHLIPQIGSLIEQLSSLGALCARMTGSGSCVFGAFTTRAQAQHAARRIHAPFKTVCRTSPQAISIDYARSTVVDK